MSEGNIREQLELGDADRILKIVYGPEACWILQQIMGMTREQAMLVLETLKENA